MTARLATLALAAASCSFAQITLFRAPEETRVEGLLDVGTAAPGDTLDTRLRLRNLGTAPATLSILLADGVGFSVQGAPSLPQLMAPGTNVDFRIRFRPVAPGVHSATLRINTTAVLVKGNAPASLTLLRSGVALNNSDPVELGTVTLGRATRFPLVLRNDSDQDLAIARLAVSGAGFSLGPLPLPQSVRAGAQAAFDLICDPVRSGLMQGTLQLDNRTFTLAALAREPEAPAALIELAPTAARSGRQSSLRVRLAGPAPLAVTGTLRLDFLPTVTVDAGDAAIQFLANSARTISVDIKAGDSEATVNGRPDIAFQTGTTAGVATFRLTLGTQEIQVPITIPAEAPALDTVEMRTSTGAVDVTITGFDNHHSAGNIVFTFTDRTGQDLPAISAEAGTPFANFFRESRMGGLFRLSARFPVNGDSSALARVSVRLANSIGAGTAKSE